MYRLIIITGFILRFILLCHSRYGNSHQYDYEKVFSDNVVSVVNNFDNLNIILNRTKKYNPNGRNETEDQAREVDEAIRMRLTENAMVWKDVPGNFEGINTIANMVLSKLNIDNMLFSVKLTE